MYAIKLFLFCFPFFLFYRGVVGRDLADGVRVIGREGGRMEGCGGEWKAVVGQGRGGGTVSRRCLDECFEFLRGSVGSSGRIRLGFG